MTTWQHVNQDVQVRPGVFRHVTVRTLPSEAAEIYADELNASTHGKANATTSDERVNVPAEIPAWYLAEHS